MNWPQSPAKAYMYECLAVTGDHSIKDQMFLAEIEKNIGFVCTVGPLQYDPP